MEHLGIPRYPERPSVRINEKIERIKKLRINLLGAFCS